MVNSSNGRQEHPTVEPTRDDQEKHPAAATNGTGKTASRSRASSSNQQRAYGKETDRTNLQQRPTSTDNSNSAARTSRSDQRWSGDINQQDDEKQRRAATIKGSTCDKRK